MKKLSVILALLLVFAMVCSLAGCAKQGDGGGNDPTLVGTWEYVDEESGLSAVYVLNADGTGTYTMKVGEEEVVYEIKYEVQDNHLLVTYVNDETFTEDDVFDNEFSFRDAKTLIIKDSFDEELTYIKK